LRAPGIWMTDGLPSPPPWPVARGPERWLVPGRTGNFDLACGVPSRPPPRLSDSTGLPRATIPPERAPAPGAQRNPYYLSGAGRTKRLTAGPRHRPEGRPSSITSGANPPLRNLEGGPRFRQRLFCRDEARASELIRRRATRNSRTHRAALSDSRSCLSCPSS
jgi:hypothetical protein